jgi:Coenzyme PQQ synthesis protein D (PqqD)
MISTLRASVQPHPDVMAQHVNEEVVLVHLLSNQIYTLNGTATRLWELLETGHDLDGCIQTMLNEYEVTRRDLEEDVNTIVETLSELNFLVSVSR